MSGVEDSSVEEISEGLNCAVDGFTFGPEESRRVVELLFVLPLNEFDPDFCTGVWYNEIEVAVEDLHEIVVLE